MIVRLRNQQSISLLALAVHGRPLQAVGSMRSMNTGKETHMAEWWQNWRERPLKKCCKKLLMLQIGKAAGCRDHARLAQSGVEVRMVLPSLIANGALKDAVIKS